MFTRIARVKGFNLLQIMLIALWIAVLILFISSLMVDFLNGSFTMVSAIAGATLAIVCLPIALGIHRSNKNGDLRGLTFGLVLFIAIIVSSGVALYVIPPVFNTPWLAPAGQLMWFGAYAALIVPLFQNNWRHRHKLDSKIGVIFTALCIIAVVIIAYSILGAHSRLELNGFNILVYAAFVILDVVVLSLLSRLVLINLPGVYRYIYAIIFGFFLIDFISDVLSFQAYLGLTSPVDISYLPDYCMMVYAVAELFLTMALLLYSSRNFNPVTVEEVNETLQDTRCLMNDLIAQSPDAICICDVSGKAITVNAVFTRIFAVARPDTIGRSSIFDGTLPLGVPADELDRVRKGGTVVLPEIKSPDGRLYLAVKLYPTYSSNGAISGYVASAEDITERTIAEQQIIDSLEEKKILLKEIHHRVKNNLQIVSSLLNIQASSITDPTALDCFKESQQRVKSMALIHEKLYQSEDLSKVNFSEYINNLSTFLFRSYTISQRDIGLNIQVENLQIDIDMAIPCGLIVNELVSNSLKYAFPGGKTGEIRITMVVSGDHYVLTVCDNGVGFPSDLDYRNTRSLGLQLVNTLVSQLEGTIDLDRSTGTSFVITFPALKKASGPAGRLQP